MKDNINTMISNLRETTERNREQDWLKTNLAKIHGHVARPANSLPWSGCSSLALAPLVSAHRGTICISPGLKTIPELKLLSSYAPRRLRTHQSIHLGEGLTLASARWKKRILLNNVPPGSLTSCPVSAKPGK